MLELSQLELFRRLGVALAIGLLIGVERGWRGRAAQEGGRTAGLRTFGLIGLAGGFAGLLAGSFGGWVLAGGLLAIAAILVAGQIHLGMNADPDKGVTTETAAVTVFLLGAAAAVGYQTLAAAAAVVTVALLGMKPVLHQWLQRMEGDELAATLKLLMISVVVLPILPNEGFGPWEVFNPYKIWWMVVLIAAISWVGYVGVKLAGPRIGVGLTAAMGGLASSTAVTLSFARMGRENPALHRLLAAGVIVACSTMFPRILLEVAVVNRELVPRLIWPMGAMALAGYGSALWLWSSAHLPEAEQGARLKNPFELGPALQFGALLALILFLAVALREWFGDAGIYLVAGISGIADVDPITLSLAQMAREGLAPETAVRGIVLAALVNTLVKGGMVLAIGGGAMGWRAGIAFAITIAAGGAGLWLGAPL